MSFNSIHTYDRKVNIGLLPAMISVYIVPKLGLQLSTQMMLSGRRYSASGFVVVVCCKTA
jgi:hypothetical protein